MSTTVLDTALPPTRRQASQSQENLEKLWVELQSKSPNVENYFQVIRLVPGLRERAIEALEGLKPKAETLFSFYLSHRDWEGIGSPILDLIIKLHGDEQVLVTILKKIDHPSNGGYKCAGALLKVCTGNVESLSKIVESYPGLCGEASEKLLASATLTIGTLETIIRYNGENSHAEAAGRRILNMHNVGTRELLTVLEIQSLRNETWQRLQEIKTDHRTLAHIVSAHPSLRSEAAEMLLSRELPADEAFGSLFVVFQKVPELRERVWQKLEKVELSDAWLDAIVREGGVVFLARADARRKPPERNAENIVNEMILLAQH